MWMMMHGNSDELKRSGDLVIGRKLRPLMPRPMSSCTANHPYSCCCTRNPKTLSWNHPLAAPLVSTRWNPTPEQLQALEEMYRRGIRTPSAEQIQQIAAKLGSFGKIEGKNVFYWFQNHKARERQKKRRQLELLSGKNMHHKQTAGLSRRYLENEHHKKVPMASNCSTASEDSASMHGAVIAADCGWPHNLGSAAENEACCQLQLDLSSSITAPQQHTYPSLNHLITNHHDNYQNQTLHLFPTAPISQHSPNTLTLPPNVNISPTQFIEFLPIKN